MTERKEAPTQQQTDQPKDGEPKKEKCDEQKKKPTVTAKEIERRLERERFEAQRVAGRTLREKLFYQG